MKPLINLKSFLAVMVILIVSAALLVAYFRDYSPVSSGHEHGNMAHDDAKREVKSGGVAHEEMGHGAMSDSQGMQTKSPQPMRTSQPQTTRVEKGSDHASRDHDHTGNDKTAQSATEHPSPMSDQLPKRGGEEATQELADSAGSSAMPGIPGLSRLYHIGATGLFLNHADHIALTAKQQAALNVIKQKTLLSKATAQRKIDEAEQDLWELTGADKPDIVQIQAKVESIEKLRGEQRMAFIESVGKAAKVLSNDQRQTLLGSKKSDAHDGHSPAHK